ncbi:TPA: ABC transporter ATP-binding protein [Streptococcus pyogenes]|nr:ABC transporter ATP-binding protein [Streptococcus pyogenes]
MRDIFKKIYIKDRCKIILLAIMTVSTSTLGILLPYLNGKFIDNLINIKNVNHILKIVALIIILGVINIVLNYIYQIVSSKLIIKSIYDFRVEMLKHLRKIPVLKYKEFDPVYINERTRKDISEVVNFVVNNYVYIVLKIMIFIACLVVIGHLNISTLICVVMIIPVYVLVYNYYSKNIYDLSFKVKENENIFFQIYNEQLQLMEEIKIDSKYENHNRYVDCKFMKYYKSFGEYISLSTKFNTVESIVSLIFQAVLFVFGAISIINNKMSIGDLTIINSYFAIMVGIVNYYVSLGKVYQEAKVSYDRLKNINKIEEEEQGELTLDLITEVDANLNFSYKNGRDLIKNKKVKFETGRIYAVIGSNGIGKTTLVKLIIGIYHPNGNMKSEIRYDNVSIKRINLEHLRGEKIAYVSQKHRMTNKKINELFYEIDKDITLDSIYNRLSYFNDEELIGNAIDDIKLFWNSAYYELSEGEKQILSIYRALCKKPKVLILDEPSSNLDFNKKTTLKKILIAIKEQMIVIVISHDKDFLDVSDEIIELDKR